MAVPPLNSIRAQLTARNFHGARRAIRKHLKDHPDDMSALALQIKIEIEAGDKERGLELARSALATAPNSQMLRTAEFDALAGLRKKREAKEAYARFKQDFPQATYRISQMEIICTALDRDILKLRKILDDEVQRETSPATMRDIGIAYYNINDLFVAEDMLKKAHKSYPTDPKLTATLAKCSLELVKPFAAWQYASAALRLDGTNNAMRLVKLQSIAHLNPIVTLLSAAGMFERLFRAKIPSPWTHLAFIPLLFFAWPIWSFIIDVIGTISGRFSILVLLLSVLGYLGLAILIHKPEYLNRLRRKTRLRDY